MIYLGIPYGIDLDEEKFFEGKYEKAKRKLCSIRRPQFIGLVGKHRILNANYYGIFRYWLFVMNLPEETREWMASDSKMFLWKRDSKLQVDEKGTKGRMGKFIAPHFRPMKKGGGGIIHWDNHVLSFLIQTIIRYAASPREHPYKIILDKWLEMPRGNLFLNHSTSEKKSILAKVPEGATYIRSALQAFWSVNIRQSTDLSKITDPEFLAATPLRGNFLFKLKMQRKTHAELVKAGLTRISHFVDTTNNRPLRHREFLPHLRAVVTRNELGKVAAIAARAAAQIPSEIIQILSGPKQPFVRGDVVGLVDDLGDKQLGVYEWPRLTEVRKDSTGFAVKISTPHDLTTWDNSELNELTRISMWGDKSRAFRPIRGEMSSIYPQDEGWTVLGGTKQFLLS